MKCTQKAEKKLFLEGDLFMDGGKIAADGTPEEIIDHPENQRLQQFLNFVNR